MLPKEFEERTGMKPTEEEFYYINAVYMETSMDKDEFCKEFKKHGASKILRDVHVRAVNNELQTKNAEARHQATLDLCREIAEVLIGKSKVYDDPDFRSLACRLIGEKEVVKATLDMGLPLGADDVQYLKMIMANI